jgi:phosphotriesterase-related protein
MSEVQTVRGSIDSSQLGATLMHEHVFVLSPEIMQNYPGLWGDEQHRIDDAVTRLDALAASGVRSLVDLTVIGMGRYIPRIQLLADRTSLNIIVATGLYTYNDVPFYFYFRGPGTLIGGPEPMTEIFIRDIQHGIADTGVRAGILKCATDAPGLTPGVERVLRAVAQAHRQTGVPISTHTHVHTKRGLDQQRVFLEEGVDLSRVIIGHSGDTTDIDYLEELIGAGSYLGMDRFGLDLRLPFEARVDTLVRLCQRGHANRLVLSHDTACFLDWLPEAVRAATLPNWHYLLSTETCFRRSGPAGYRMIRFTPCWSTIHVRPLKGWARTEAGFSGLPS